MTCAVTSAVLNLFKLNANTIPIKQIHAKQQLLINGSLIFWHVNAPALTIPLPKCYFYDVQKAIYDETTDIRWSIIKPAGSLLTVGFKLYSHEFWKVWIFEFRLHNQIHHQKWVRNRKNVKLLKINRSRDLIFDDESDYVVEIRKIQTFQNSWE